MVRKSLEVVIKMRQVGHRQFGAIFSHHDCGSVGNPFTAGKSSIGAPKREKRERTQTPDQIALGVIKNVKYFGAVTSIMWFWGRAVLHRGRLIEPPEHFGSFNSLVKLFSFDQ